MNVEVLSHGVVLIDRDSENPLLLIYKFTEQEDVQWVSTAKPFEDRVGWKLYENKKYFIWKGLRLFWRVLEGSLVGDLSDFTPLIRSLKADKLDWTSFSPWTEFIEEFENKICDGTF